MTIDSSDLSTLPEVARKIIDFAGDERIWLFQGDLGAGKTTLIKYLCHELGVIDAVSSPTFSLVNQYETDKGGEVYHFDMYRIETEEEASNLGLDEYFYSGNLCLIEWPEKIPHLIPEQYLKININFIAENRTIHLTKNGPED